MRAIRDEAGGLKCGVGLQRNLTAGSLEEGTRIQTCKAPCSMDHRVRRPVIALVAMAKGGRTEAAGKSCVPVQVDAGSMSPSRPLCGIIEPSHQALKI